MKTPVNIDDYKSNIKLIYDYSEKAVKIVDASIDRLNIKMGVVFGLDIFLIYSFISIADITPFLDCTLCLILRVISYHFLIFSLCFCLSGLKPKKSGSIILPEELLEKCLNLADDQYRMLIIANWSQSIKELAETRDALSIQVDGALVNLALAAIFASVSSMEPILLG